MTDLINLYRQAEDYFFRGISSKCLDLDHGAHAYMTGGAELNFIYITRNTNVLDKILIQGKQFFNQDNLTFDVIIPQELCTPQMADVLNAMGYPQKSKSVSMIVDLDRFATDKTLSFDSETTIKPNDNQLNDWMMPLVGAFESTFEICRIYAGIHENALKRNINLRHFSLYKQEQPIASITLSMHDNTIARIDDVGTLPELQGKGYATHLMRYVLSEAKRLGARHCFLESSDSGLGVYKKLGFEPLFKNNIYEFQSEKLEQFRKTTVVPYDPAWPTLYEIEQTKVKKKLKISVATHHIGSTSVHGMCAKPVIDIMLLVDNIDELDQHQKALESIGYHWMGEYGIPGRRYLWKIGNGAVDFHLQCFQKDHIAATNCIFFRDFLRSNSQKAMEYSKEKKRASKKFPNDTHAYWYEKKAFVDLLLEEAKSWQNKNNAEKKR